MLDMNKVKDRSNKWSTSMMLTEHVEKLRDWYAEDNYVSRPQFDDWELEAIQMELELAYKRQTSATVTVWRNGRTDPYIGKISELNHRLGYISVDGPFGHDRIPVSDIIKVDSLY